MNIATPTAAYKPFFPNPANSLAILPFHIASWRKETLGLTLAQKGAIVELKTAASERGGSLPNDDSYIARVLGVTKAVWLKIKAAVLGVTQIVGDMIVFPGLISELDHLLDVRKKRSEAGRACHQKMTPRMGSKEKARSPEKSNEINGTLSANAGANATANAEHHNHSKKEGSKEGQKEREESPPTPSGGGDPDWVDPFSDEAPRAEAADFSSSPPPPPSAPPSRRRDRCAIPEGWKPNASTRAWAEKLGLSDARVEELAEEFASYWEGDGRPKKNWDKTFQNRILDLKSKGSLNKASKPFKADGEWVHNSRGDRVWQQA